MCLMQYNKVLSLAPYIRLCNSNTQYCTAHPNPSWLDPSKNPSNHKSPGLSSVLTEPIYLTHPKTFGRQSLRLHNRLSEHKINRTLLVLACQSNSVLFLRVTFTQKMKGNRRDFYSTRTAPNKTQREIPGGRDGDFVDPVQSHSRSVTLRGPRVYVLVGNHNSQSQAPFRIPNNERGASRKHVHTRRQTSREQRLEREKQYNILVKLTPALLKSQFISTPVIDFINKVPSGAAWPSKFRRTGCVSVDRKS